MFSTLGKVPHQMPPVGGGGGSTWVSQPDQSMASVMVSAPPPIVTNDLQQMGTHSLKIQETRSVETPTISEPTVTNSRTYTEDMEATVTTKVYDSRGGVGPVSSSFPGSTVQGLNGPLTLVSSKSNSVPQTSLSYTTPSLASSHLVGGRSTIVSHGQHGVHATHGMHATPATSTYSQHHSLPSYASTTSFSQPHPSYASTTSSFVHPQHFVSSSATSVPYRHIGGSTVSPSLHSSITRSPLLPMGTHGPVISHSESGRIYQVEGAQKSIYHPSSGGASYSTLSTGPGSTATTIPLSSTKFHSTTSSVQPMMGHSVASKSNQK